MTSTCFIRSIRSALLLLLLVIAARTPAMAAPAAVGRWVLADFDGDQKSDLAELGPSSLALRLSSGLRWNLPLVDDIASSSMGIVVVDIDGDSNLDIVVQDRLSPRHHHVWLNNGNGSFIETSRFRNPIPAGHKYWNRPPVPVLESAAPARSRESIPELTSVHLHRPAAMGFRAYEAPACLAARFAANTVRLRAPPLSALY